MISTPSMPSPMSGLIIGAGLWCDPADRSGAPSMPEAQAASVLRAEAIAAFDRGELREALRLWRQVLASSTRTKDALFQVACCHALLDEPAQACNAFLSVAGDVRVDNRLRRRAAELARLVDPIAP